MMWLLVVWFFVRPPNPGETGWEVLDGFDGRDGIVACMLAGIARNESGLYCVDADRFEEEIKD